MTGYLFSAGPADALGIGGMTSGGLGRLIACERMHGKAEIQPNTWNHVVMVRDGRQVKVFLNGGASLEISGEVARDQQDRVTRVFVGGRQDNAYNFEGKIDEVALDDRPLIQAEVAKHFQSGQAERGNSTGDQD